MPIPLAAESLDRLAEYANRGEKLIVDLASNSIHYGDKRIAFEVPALQRVALLEGLDQIGLTMQRLGDIEAFGQRDAAARPWLVRGV